MTFGGRRICTIVGLACALFVAGSIAAQAQETTPGSPEPLPAPTRARLSSIR